MTRVNCTPLKFNLEFKDVTERGRRYYYSTYSEAILHMSGMLTAL